MHGQQLVGRVASFVCVCARSPGLLNANTPFILGDGRAFEKSQCSNYISPHAFAHPDLIFQMVYSQSLSFAALEAIDS